MKKLGITFLIAGAAVNFFALLARIIPGITITNFMAGFLTGSGSALLLFGLWFWLSALLKERKNAKKS